MIKYNLRSEAYPFDWCAISLYQLINILENKFENYYESLRILKKSNKHLDIDGNPTCILTNDYHIRYAHEIKTEYELEEFKNKIKRRIDRFKNLDQSQSKTSFQGDSVLWTRKIIFIRIELNPINNVYVNKLINVLDKTFNNYELRLILCDTEIKCDSDKVKIYKYKNYSHNWKLNDWKMDHLKWKVIFGIKNNNNL
jgi:hypothetical protein